jgi:DNA-binding transcriptional ArsR family regulator
MTSFRNQLQENVLDFTWSLWAELLVLFTAALGDADPRLRDESMDWSVTYGRYVSGTRLKNLLETQTPAVQSTFGEIAATVSAHSAARWPQRSKARRFERTGRSIIDDFLRPSLIVLRLRAFLGVGARAEIVRSFVADPSEKFTAADLAAETDYTKRNVAEALEALRMAGLVQAVPLRNQLQYRLTSSDVLAHLPGEMPHTFPRWRAIFRILGALLEAAQRAEHLNATTRRVEASDVLHALAPDLHALGLQSPLSDSRGRDSWAAFESWALAMSSAWASGQPHAAWRER